MPGQKFTLEVRPTLPASIARLADLANDLLYSWDRGVRSLFRRLDVELYQRCNHNPKLLLRRISQERLDAAAADTKFLQEYEAAIVRYDLYRGQALVPDLRRSLDPSRDLIAYFCLEFGFHESVQIYSGGLGVLAADHCRAASDLALPFVAVGILYRQGYFEQTIDKHGHQVEHFKPTRFGDLPVQPALDAAGDPLAVHVRIGKEDVELAVWSMNVGNIRVLLLDSDREANTPAMRAITYQLYGGGDDTRIRQEMVLGMGGVRALRALGLAPNAWHSNEGHAGFQCLERCRELTAGGMPFDTAWEIVAAATAFTTHTPVPAGHDVFHDDMVLEHVGWIASELGISHEALLALGRRDGNPGFNMTALSLRGARRHNGVSRIHGRVTARMEAVHWPEIEAHENPIEFITNGVHLATFLAMEWADLFDARLGNWRAGITPEEIAGAIDSIPDHRFWSLRKGMKAKLVADLLQRVLRQHTRNGVGSATIRRITALLEDPAQDLMIIGFARRFATYKRAGLLFRDPDRLARILSDAERPVLIVLAGKAHPNDEPGKSLIRSLHQLSMEERFLGKVLVVEGYDMALARNLVAGVDVWLNTPLHPHEASGTSGAKAAANGVVNLSILDGWWAEGWNGDNGWAISPHDDHFDEGYREHEESNDLLDLLENEVLPLYFERDHVGFSRGWMDRARASMKSIMPRFNATRMVREYIEKMYVPAIAQSRSLLADEGAGARELAAWKARVRTAWPAVALHRRDAAPETVPSGDALALLVEVELGGLAPEDLVVECVITPDGSEADAHPQCHRLTVTPDAVTPGSALFRAEVVTGIPGLQHYQLRAYPHHPHLAHPFELGMMRWV